MSRRLLIGLALAALAGSAVLGVRSRSLEAAAEHPPTFARLLKYVPTYPGSYTYPLGGSLHVDGLPREMGWSLTDAAPDAVADHYAGRWQSEGWRVEKQIGEASLAVIAISRTDALVKSVVCSRHDDGKTVIVASLTELGDEAPVTVRAPDGCETLRSTGARDGAVTTEVATFDCPVSIDALTAFYDSLGGERRAQVLPEAGRRDLEATWTAGARQTTVVATQTSDTPPHTTATVTWQEERR